MNYLEAIQFSCTCFARALILHNPLANFKHGEYLGREELYDFIATDYNTCLVNAHQEILLKYNYSDDVQYTSTSVQAFIDDIVLRHTRDAEKALQNFTRKAKLAYIDNLPTEEMRCVVRALDNDDIYNSTFKTN